MSDIFISYANEDRPWAQMFARALEARGWSIFWDQTIPFGNTWRNTIERELKEARCVIVLWSKTSIESEWVRDEADDAKQRRVLVPVRIDDIQPPFGFRNIQTADLTDWRATNPTAAFDRLTADIAARIGSPSKQTDRQVARVNNDATHKADYENAAGENYRSSPSPSATPLVKRTATPTPSVLATVETKQSRLDLALRELFPD
jgi:hypothetical protein